MSNKVLEGMARAICLAIWDHDYTPRNPLHPDSRWLQAMRAAKAGADFLADNVSDEMARAASDAHEAADFNHGEAEWMKAAITAALRQAAGGGE